MRYLEKVSPEYIAIYLLSTSPLRSASCPGGLASTVKYAGVKLFGELPWWSGQLLDGGPVDSCPYSGRGGHVLTIPLQGSLTPANVNMQHSLAWDMGYFFLPSLSQNFA